MQLTPIQNAFATSASPVTSFGVTLANATTPGNVLLVTARFGAVPVALADSFGNPLTTLFAVTVSSGVLFRVWAIRLDRAGSGHAVTIVTTGPAQSWELSVAEVSGQDVTPLESARDLLAAILSQEISQTQFLQRLVTAERA